MKAPFFFYQRKIHLYALLLTPLGFLYYIAFKVKKLLSKQVKNDNIFSIRIGNITAGGTGKTEIAKLIGLFFKEKGIKFCFLSRGYGRSSSGTIKVEFSSEPDPLFVGDEVAILSKYADVFVTNDRKDTFSGVNGYDVVIMDDGLQDYCIDADLNILLIDANHGFGNGMLLPSGPMRCMKRDLPRIDIAVQTSTNDGILNNDTIEISRNLGIKNVFTSKVLSSLSPTKERYIAFSGLGLNKKFLSSLNENGYNIVNFIEFPDHYLYNESDIYNIINCDDELGIITTEKDYMKVKNFDTSKRIEVFYIDHKIDDNFLSIIDNRFLLYRDENRNKG